jgi:Caspase domain
LRPARPADSRAILIGVSAYEYAEFPPIRAARNSLQAMHALLSDPALCGWPPGQITVIANPISAADLAAEVADLAEGTTGVLLLYYVGHGMLSARGELCLTVTSTRPNRPKISGLAWDILADIVRACPARARLVILDCCFAGQAIEALGAGDGPGLADIAHVEGAYTLTATTRNRTAHVPPPDQQDTACTSFTGELRDLIREGIAGRPPRLTFSDIYPVLRQRLHGKGMPIPSQRGTGTALQFPFTANAAALAAPGAQSTPREEGSLGEPARKDPEHARTDPARATHILTGALRVAQDIDRQDSKAWALADIAEAMARTDPDRAARLIADAERVARSTPEEHWKAQLSPSLAQEQPKAWSQALALVARKVAAIDPDHAERIAQSITDEQPRAWALAGIAEALAITDPDRAERIAQSITSQAWKASALAGIAKMVVAIDADRAVRLITNAQRAAQTITTTYESPDAAVEGIAVALAAIDPDRAEQYIQWMKDGISKAAALAAIARALAATDPDRAERIAEAIDSQPLKAQELARIAGTVAATDPDRAVRLLAGAERVAAPEPTRSLAMAAIAEAVASTDPDHAERIAQAITEKVAMASALAGIAGTVASTDPDRAVRLLNDAEHAAQSIPDGYGKVSALVCIAKIWLQSL